VFGWRWGHELEARVKIKVRMIHARGMYIHELRYGLCILSRAFLISAACLGEGLAVGGEDTGGDVPDALFTLFMLLCGTCTHDTYWLLRREAVRWLGGELVE